MNFYDMLYKIAKENGMTFERLSWKLGHSASYIGGSKSRGSLPRIDNAARIIDACGYTLCVVPKDNVPDGAMTIDF